MDAVAAFVAEKLVALRKAKFGNLPHEVGASVDTIINAGVVIAKHYADDLAKKLIEKAK